MAAPTETQIQTMIRNAIHVAETLRESVQDGGSSLVSLIEAFLQALKGDTTAAATAGVDVLSEALATGISSANLRAILDPLFCDYARNLGFPEKEAEDILDRLYVDFDANSKTVKTRGITFGTPTFSGATGNGVIHRLTRDGYNRDIEALSSLPSGGEAKSAACVKDQAHVNRHEEVFLFRGAEASVTGLERLGSGLSMEIAAVSAANSLLSNPAFLEGTSGSEVSDWTFAAGSAADTAQDSNYYRSVPGTSQTGSLKLNASVTLKQKLSVSGNTLLPNTPYYAHVVFNAEIHHGEGDLLLYLGNERSDVTISSQTGWNELSFISWNSWHRSFMQDKLSVKVEWSRTNGSLLIGEVILTPLVNFDGTWYLPVGGSTPFLVGDKANWTDSETGAVIQNWLADTYGKYLPHAASPTWTEP